MRSSLLTQMFGMGVVAATAAPKSTFSELFPDELLYISKAVEKRQAEFGTVRVLARRCLVELGIEPCSLVPHSDRSPRWPAGVKGTIAHTAHLCAVAVTNRSDIQGIGLDLEEDTPLQRDLEPIICTASERRWLDQFPQVERLRIGKLIFSAKEAFYKCQYDTTRTLIDFQDVTLEFNMKARTFRVTNITRDDPSWDKVTQAIGRFQRTSGLLITTALLHN